MSSSASKIRRSTRLAIFLRDGLRCVYCGGETPFVRLSIDHINERGFDLERSEGRYRSLKHHPSRLVTSCFSCNSSKKDMSVSEFCDQNGLRRSVVWRRIRTRTRKPIEPYREMVRLLWLRGKPEWFSRMERGYTEPVDPPSEEEIEAWMIDSL